MKKITKISLIAAAIASTQSIAAVHHTEISPFNMEQINVLKTKKALTTVKNPVNELEAITLMSGIPLRDEVPTLAGGDLTGLMEFIKHIDSERPEGYGINLLDNISIENKGIKPAKIIWIGESVKYHLLTEELKPLNTDLIFWHQIGHTVGMPQSVSDRLNSLSDDSISATRMSQEILADTFSILAISKQHNLTYEEMFKLAQNIKDNRLNIMMDTEGKDPLHYFTLPGLDATLKLTRMIGLNPSEASYKQLYTLATNITLHTMSADLREYVSLTMNEQDPHTMADYIYKLSLAQRCITCETFNFTSFEKTLDPLYLYNETNAIALDIFTRNDELKKLNNDDFNIRIYELLKPIEGSKGMKDYEGRYHLFHNQVTYKLYQNGMEYSPAYVKLVESVISNVLDNFSTEWMDVSYSMGGNAFGFESKRAYINNMFNKLFD